MQHTPQNLLSHWQNPVNFTAREGGVKEEANLDVLDSITQLFPEHGRHEHEVIIMDPDQVVILDGFRDLSGKDPVCVAVGDPRTLVKADLARVVMEQRPQD